MEEGLSSLEKTIFFTRFAKFFMPSTFYQLIFNVNVTIFQESIQISSVTTSRKIIFK